jgi:hypothetical protein
VKIANYIYSILKSKQIVMWSWGFHNPIALPNNEGLIFCVNGFKHNGYVKVIYNEGKDLFIIILLDNQNIELKRIEDVYFDSLVDVIDEAVELTSDYEERVKKKYNN